MTNLINPNEVPEYAIQSLIEEWRSVTGKEITQALFCSYRNYSSLLKEYGLIDKGLPHVCMSRKILEVFDSSGRYDYSQDIKKECLATWLEEDTDLYVIIVIES